MSDQTSNPDQQAGLSVTVDRGDSGPVVIVKGEIDLETSPELSAVLATLEPPGGDADVDLSGVTYIDSTGLRALLTARDAAREAGGSLRVSATSSIVARLIEITGCNELLER
jgi:anti-sigma B factor antagonist